jgi:alanine racemase
VLWGPELPVENVAQRAGTIPYELLCAVSQRVPVSLE